MTDPIAILTVATRVLLVDWPTRDVPDALARAGLDVVVHGGPGPEDYFAYEVADGEVVERRVGRPPDCADKVYTSRPPGRASRDRGAGSRRRCRCGLDPLGLAADGERDPTGCWLAEEVAAAARAVVESAGLVYVDRPYIADVARST